MDSLPERVEGRRVVGTVVAVLLGVAVLFGVLVGAVVVPIRVDDPTPVATFGPLSVPITPLTMAAYGLVSVGSVLLVGLLLVRYVSARADESSA